MITQPRISVVVPTYNRAGQLAECLQALGEQDLAATDFEILVVDDGSREPLEPIIERATTKVQIRLLKQHNAGPAVARNLGAQYARAEFLAFTDDDCRPAPGWLRAMLECLSANPQALVGGQTFNALPSNVYSTTSQMLIDFLYERYTGKAGSTLFFASNNFALARSRFFSLGGFTNTCNRAAEDREFCHLWHEAGWPAVFAPEANVYHAHRLTLTSFWRQHFMYGRGAYQFRTALVARGARPVKIEGPNFYRELLCYPWRNAQPARPSICTALMALSQAANIAGFGFEALFGRRMRTKASTNRTSDVHALASGATEAGVAAERPRRAEANRIDTSESAAATTT